MTPALLGGALLLACGLFVGLALSGEAEREARQAAALARFFGELRLQISAFCTPLRDILRQCDPQLLKDCGFHTVESTTKRVLSPPLALPLVQALLESAEWHLPAALRTRLLTLTSTMGRGTRSDQLAVADAVLGLLNPEAARLQKELRGRKGSTVALSLTVAATVILLLL